MSITSLCQYARDFGFKFIKSQKQADDETMVALIRGYMAEGHSRRQCCELVDIGHDKMRRLTSEFLIEWPAHKYDPYKSGRRG